MGQRAIIHVDMDAFFASVEVLDNPELAGKPVAVGGRPESRGVVAAASYELRRYGVHSAMSAWRAKKLCPQIIFIRPRFRRYSEISDRIFRIFKDYTPLVEPLSIDEAFLDVTASQSLFGSAERIGLTIKRRIREEIGLIASVGVAGNKFLAKLASDLRKPDGFVVIRDEEAEALLADLPISRIWGVGKVTERQLASLGIHLIGHLRHCPVELLKQHVGSFAEHLLQFARGIDERPVEPLAESKSIGAETTFVRDIGARQELRGQLGRLAEEVARRLRHEGLQGRTVHIKVRYPDFTTMTRAATLPEPTALTLVIRDAAGHLLEKQLGRDGRPLRLLGISVSNLIRAGEGQIDLFQEEQLKRYGQIDQLLDQLQDAHGRAKVQRGTHLLESQDD